MKLCNLGVVRRVFEKGFVDDCNYDRLGDIYPKKDNDRKWALDQDLVNRVGYASYTANRLSPIWKKSWKKSHWLNPRTNKLVELAW